MAPTDDPNPTTLKKEKSCGRRVVWVLGGVAVILAAFAAVTASGWMHAIQDAADDTKFDSLPYIKGGLWRAAVINAVLCALLAATARWWAVETNRPESKTSESSVPLSRKALVGLILILGVAGAVRWARMDLSFYNDEAHAFRRYVAGRFSETRELKLKWKPVDWIDTVWLNEVGSNLMPASIFGRLSYDAWRKVTHAPLGAVSESAVRLQAWITGMASLVVLWLLARRVLPGAGAWWALLLAAFHPWMVRYSTEARGYGFLTLGVTLAFYFLARALEDHRWRWWVGFGLAQFLCMWAFPGALYFLAALNGLLMVRQLWAWKCAGEGTRVVWRPLVGMLVGGMVTLQVTLPSMLQLLRIAKKLDSLNYPMGSAWWQDVWSGLAFGVRGVDQDPGNPDNLALDRMLGEQPWLWVVVGLAALLGLLGLRELVKRPGGTWIVALAGPLAVVLSWVILRAQGTYLHPWYLLYALPGLLLAWAAAPLWFSRWREFGPGAVGQVSLPLLVLFWLSVDLHYARMGKENLRGLAETARGEKYRPGWVADKPESSFAAMFSDAMLYDPWIKVIKGSADLDGIVEEARKERRPLYISVGHVGIADTPQLYERLLHSGEFEPVATLHGMEEEQFTHHLFRLR